MIVLADYIVSVVVVLTDCIGGMVELVDCIVGILVVVSLWWLCWWWLC